MSPLFIDPTERIEPTSIQTFGQALSSGSAGNTIQLRLPDGTTENATVAGKPIKQYDKVAIIQTPVGWWAIHPDGKYPSQRIIPLASWRQKAPGSLFIRYCMRNNPVRHRFLACAVSSTSGHSAQVITPDGISSTVPIRFGVEQVTAKAPARGLLFCRQGTYELIGGGSKRLVLLFHPPDYLYSYKYKFNGSAFDAYGYEGEIAIAQLNAHYAAAIDSFKAQFPDAVENPASGVASADSPNGFYVTQYVNIGPGNNLWWHHVVYFYIKTAVLAAPDPFSGVAAAISAVFNAIPDTVELPVSLRNGDYQTSISDIKPEEYDKILCIYWSKNNLATQTVARLANTHGADKVTKIIIDANDDLSVFRNALAIQANRWSSQ